MSNSAEHHPSIISFWSQMQICAAQVFQGKSQHYSPGGRRDGYEYFGPSTHASPFQ
jgi:hypothetical protein